MKEVRTRILSTEWREIELLSRAMEQVHGQENEVRDDPRCLLGLQRKGGSRAQRLSHLALGLIPSPPMNGFVTLGKLLKLPMLQFPHLYYGNSSKNLSQRIL